MQAVANGVSARLDLEGKMEVTFKVEPQSAAAVKSLVNEHSGKRLSLEVKPYRKRRSLDANAYMWVLVTKIAAVLRTSKDEVYRHLIKAVGRCAPLAVRERDAERIINGWSNRGLGWFAEQMDTCKLDGCARVMFYFGSSDYDTEEMSRLLDEAITTAKELGIETATPIEQYTMLQRWEAEHAQVN